MHIIFGYCDLKALCDIMIHSIINGAVVNLRFRPVQQCLFSTMICGIFARKGHTTRHLRRTHCGCDIDISRFRAADISVA